MSFQPKHALHELYINCQAELEAFLFTKLQCRETAADICQEAYIRVFQAKNLEQIDNLKSYLFRTALNLHVDHFRSLAVRQANATEWLDDTPLELADLRSPEAVVLGELELQAIIEALSTLSPLCQRIFYLHRFEGLKQREIAEKLDISNRTVEENIKRALVHCAKSLT